MQILTWQNTEDEKRSYDIALATALKAVSAKASEEGPLYDAAIAVIENNGKNISQLPLSYLTKELNAITHVMNDPLNIDALAKLDAVAKAVPISNDSIKFYQRAIGLASLAVVATAVTGGILGPAFLAAGMALLAVQVIPPLFGIPAMSLSGLLSGAVVGGIITPKLIMPKLESMAAAAMSTITSALMGDENTRYNSAVKTLHATITNNKIKNPELTNAAEDALNKIQNIKSENASVNLPQLTKSLHMLNEGLNDPVKLSKKLKAEETPSYLTQFMTKLIKNNASDITVGAVAVPALNAAIMAVATGGTSIPVQILGSIIPMSAQALGTAAQVAVVGKIAETATTNETTVNPLADFIRLAATAQERSLATITENFNHAITTEKTHSEKSHLTPLENTLRPSIHVVALPRAAVLVEQTVEDKPEEDENETRHFTE